MMKRLLLSFGSTIAFLFSFAQVPTRTETDSVVLPGADTARIVHIIKADKFRLIDKDTTKLNMFVGNVLIQQGNTIISCDSVVQNQLLNQIEAFGNVHINDADSVHTYSQYLKYLGDTRIAYLKKNVRLTDGKASLTTNDLEYDLNSGIGIYRNNGKLVDGNNVLTSKEGFYYSDTKEAYFIKDVKLVSPDRTVATDTLLYNSDQDLFTLVSPTTIKDGNTVIKTSSGIYDAKNGLANFSSRTLIEDSSQQIIADNINFDKNSGAGTAEGNVIYKDTAQGVTILAGTTAFNNKTKNVLATRKPVMIIKQEKDSIYVAADTLFSSMKLDSVTRQISDTTVAATEVKSGTDSIRFFQAFRHVKIFSDSLQGVCDSLYYSAKDSVFRMFREPFVWSGENQISGDTIYMFTKNKQPDQLYVFENGFAISRTKENFFNQISGNRINGNFIDGKIDFMRAKGNAESVYYLQDDDSAYIGMNYAKADAITMYFGKDGLRRVSWVNNVEATAYPMNQIPDDRKKLRNFSWMDERRPKTRLELFQ
jgi:lipopolysaccharide transport protein LptA